MSYIYVVNVNNTIYYFYIRPNISCTVLGIFIKCSLYNTSLKQCGLKVPVPNLLLRDKQVTLILRLNCAQNRCKCLSKKSEDPSILTEFFLFKTSFYWNITEIFLLIMFFHIACLNYFNPNQGRLLKGYLKATNLWLIETFPSLFWGKIHFLQPYQNRKFSCYKFSQHFSL